MVWTGPTTAGYLVHECSPREVSNGLQPVVEEQLRQHEEEPKGIHTVDQTVDAPGVPAGGEKQQWVCHSVCGCVIL